MDDLDAAVALVYAQPPSGFVAARTTLVRELKAAKRKEEAGLVASLRRPTKQAWAVGAAVRRAAEEAAAFFDAIAELARPAGDVRQRTNDLRAATAALVEAAGGLDPGEATAALLAVAADPDATDALRRGRLAEVPAAGGFGGLTLAEPATGAPAAPESAGPDRRPDDEPAPNGEAVAAPDESAADAEAAVERDRQEAEARAEHLAALVAERDRAVAAEAAAAGWVEAAQAALEEAGAELARAGVALAEARRAAEAAADRLREAAPAQERR